MPSPALKTDPVIRPLGRPQKIAYCDECGRPFYQTQATRRFCQDACRNAHHKREATQGKRAVEALKTWYRKRGKGSFTDLSQLASQLCAEDREHKAKVKATIKAHKDQEAGK